MGVYDLIGSTCFVIDVFTWAYERSCQRYLAITHALSEFQAWKTHLGSGPLDDAKLKKDKSL